MSTPLRVAFVHPDLGLGGAERLVVEAALALRDRGHSVALFTAHHDPRRALKETVDGSLDVHVHADWLPRQIAQRLRAPCAVARMAWVAAALSSQRERYDVLFCDGVSHVIPLLRRLGHKRTVFYCHYPDRFLAPPPVGWYGWYRRPIDWLERRGLELADRVLVNSRFTAAELARAFPRLAVVPEVLYPGVELNDATPMSRTSGDIVFVSINRYDPAKNLPLALYAFAEACARAGDVATRLRLVIAGGFDERLREQRDVLEQLGQRVRILGLQGRVTLRVSVSDDERRELLRRCRGVLYTPTSEHFGFGPIEAMAAARPVIAVDSGGPRETVVDGETGFRCAPSPAAFAGAMLRLAGDVDLAERLGRAGRARVEKSFSRAAFGARLAQIVALVAGLRTED